MLKSSFLESLKDSFKGVSVLDKTLFNLIMLCGLINALLMVFCALSLIEIIKMI